MATYIDLVNFALRESGSTLDQLTTSPDTWTSPSDNLYTKFKQWTKQAWLDIQTERRDWEYMQNSAVIQYRPAMEVYGCVGATTSTSDFTSIPLRLHNAANSAVLTTTSLSHTGTFASGTEGTLSIASFDEDFIIEPGDVLINAAGTTSCYFKRWSTFGFSQTGAAALDGISDVAEIKIDSVALTDRQYAVSQSLSSVTYDKLEYVPYNMWLRYGYDRPVRVGTPTKFTLAHDGRLAFYPPLETRSHVYFEYYKTPQEFSASTDTPTGLPSRFHDAIAWRALLYYGQFDGINRIASIAAERYKKYEYEMVRDLLPETKVGYDARRW